MKFIHLADIHASKERAIPCLDVLSKVINYIRTQKEKVAVLIAGDFWDSVITNTECFADFMAALKSIIDTAIVYMIYGTPTHEPMGSLAFAEELGANVFVSNKFVNTDAFELIAIPEPRRSFYSKEKNIDKTINETLKKFIESIPPKTNKIRIVMYHGEVVGSQFDNGQLASSKIALSPALLKSLNADYYALGHIHLPQEVFKNCFYVGSSYPKNFGEHHNAGMNIVSVENGKISVERVSFGFPENVTECIEFEKVDTLQNKDYTNKRVHIKIDIDKELKKTFNVENLKRKLQEKTNAVEIKISFNYITTTNIRSEEVSKTKSLVEKFEIYAELNSIKYETSLLDKIHDIENNMLIEQFTPSQSFELEYLSLRGAIGIKDGIGKDEIEIDFTQYSDGILAIIGENGSGKTTILENCHPYTQMLTRNGSLKDHFYLKDSHRILIYKTSSGKRYKISMIIDGAAKCIGTKYFVATQDFDKDEWKPLKSVDGSHESYKEWVLHTFGSLDMFLRTSFYAKEQIKSIPDLSRSTKSEKMEFFSTLTGSDYLSIVSEEAKIKAKEEQEKIIELKSNIKDFDKVKTDIDELEISIINDKVELDKYNQLLEVDKKELDIYKVEQEKYLAVANSLSLLKSNLKTQVELEKTLSEQFVSLDNEVKEIQDLLELKEDYEKQYKWVQENTSKKQQLKDDMKKLQDDVYNKKIKCREVEVLVSNLNNDKLKIQKDVNRVEVRLESLQRAKPELNGKCPICGSTLSPEKKLKIENDIKNIDKEIAILNKNLKDNKESIEQLDSKISLMNVEQLQKEIIDIENTIFEYNEDVRQIDEYMSTLNEEQINYVVSKAENDYKEKIILKKDVSTKLEKVQDELKELEKLTKEQPKNYDDKIKRLERGILDSTMQIGSLESSIKINSKRLDSLMTLKNQINSIDKQIDEHQKSIKEYNVIEKAFGNNGIQALELDSAAPEISDITNSILRETYGDRFQLSFETQRDTVSGKHIDDFIINVFDAKSGRIKKLDVLCSGESVWIKQALYYAFSVLRNRRTGFCFRTRFLDEADGSLDSEARVKYIQMIQAAHKACNARLTLLITHSQEIKSIVEQRIELSKDSTIGN